MDAKHFDAWTRRKFGLAAGSALAALFTLRTMDEASARRRRCLRQGRACTSTGKRCCRKLQCQETKINGAFVNACCKAEGESCTVDSACCFTNCDAGKCKSCQGRPCDNERPCCPYFEGRCEGGFCGGCATEGQGCHAERPCCLDEGTCQNGFCGGCIRAFTPEDGNPPCPQNGALCCDTACTGGVCASPKDGPCARNVDCKTCADDFPASCPGACVGGTCAF
jgi:hypothetical protein